MTSENETRTGSRAVTARRITNGENGVEAHDDGCDVAVEAPLTIDIGDLDSFTLLCTPNGDEEAMAVGFLFSEAVIDGMDDIESMRPCEDDPGVMRVRLSPTSPRGHGQGRNLLIVSSCGMCGSESIEDKVAQMPRVGDTLKVPVQNLWSAQRSLRRRQRLFERCGGTHAAGIFDAEGHIVSFAEDIGRHNALDKAIGQCLIDGRSPAGLGAALSGRVSLEMVGKAARAGIELIAAVSAPTSLALDAAEHCGITLCAFVRETRATVFAGPPRVVD
jgi:FdhD protein